MKKILKGIGILAGLVAIGVGGKMIYDHLNPEEDVIDDAAEVIEEEVAEDVTAVVDTPEETEV